jgi:DNA-binding beta-propeller fold protein YncE
MALNDGDGSKTTNSAFFIDVMAGSSKYLKAAGEIPLGIGHHKASFSSTKERVAISNIGDCDDVISVFDFSDIANIKKLASLTAAQAGWNDSTNLCDQTYQKGMPPAPHGCASSKVSGKAYCNLTGSGDIAAVDIDAAAPAFKLIHTHGSGAGYTKSHPDGKYIYSLQNEPREASQWTPGVACQIGQLVVIDATKDSVVKEVKLLYKGPACTDSISKGDEATTEPAHLLVSDDKQKLFVQTAGGYGVTTARTRQELALDISDPANPVQLPSIGIGLSTGYHSETLSGDGKYLFETNNLDGTVTQIDAEAWTVLKTLTVKATPKAVATWGKVEGPSHQTGPFH